MILIGHMHAYRTCLPGNLRIGYMSDMLYRVATIRAERVRVHTARLLQFILTCEIPEVGNIDVDRGA